MKEIIFVLTVLKRRLEVMCVLGGGGRYDDELPVGHGQHDIIQIYQLLVSIWGDDRCSDRLW